jgi:hypothetical protein
MPGNAVHPLSSLFGARIEVEDGAERVARSAGDGQAFSVIVEAEGAAGMAPLQAVDVAPGDPPRAVGLLHVIQCVFQRVHRVGIPSSRMA